MSVALSGQVRVGEGKVRKDSWGWWNAGGVIFLGLGGVYSGV